MHLHPRTLSLGAGIGAPTIVNEERSKRFTRVNQEFDRYAHTMAESYLLGDVCL